MSEQDGAEWAEEEVKGGAELGQKPATIWFEKGSEDKWADVDYVNPQDGYLFVRDSARGVHYLPWHVIRGVQRDV